MVELDDTAGDAKLTVPIPPGGPEADEILLARYARSRDAGAFVALVDRHAGMVHATCHRILGRSHDAEEVAQECFLELSRHAGMPLRSVGGWLHRLATRRALNARRARGRRARHEARAGAAAPAEAAGPDRAETPADLAEAEAHLDEAIERLPGSLRAVVVAHFLEARSQESIARTLGVHQSTVSRRIRSGLGHLERRLRRRGAALTTASIAGLLAQRPAHADQAGLARSLGELAAIAGAAGPGAGLGWAWWKLAAGLRLGLLAALPYLIQLASGGWMGFLAALAMLLYLGLRRPAWFRDYCRDVGGPDADAYPPFERWTWTTPPANWRSMMLGSLMAASILGGMAAVSLFLASPPSPGVAAMNLTYATLAAWRAAKVGLRVRRCSKLSGTGEAAPGPVAPPPRLGQVIQAWAFVGVMPLAVACFVLVGIRDEPQRPAMFAIGGMMGLCFVPGLVDAVSKTGRYRRASAAGPGRADAAGGGGYVMFQVVFSAYMTCLSLVHALHLIPRINPHSSFVRMLLAARGIAPVVALIMLCTAIPTLERLGSTRWRPMVAAAVVIAVADVLLCVAWLLTG